MSNREQQTLRAISHLLRTMRSKDWETKPKDFQSGSIRSLRNMVQRIDTAGMKWKQDNRYREAVSVLLGMNRGLGSEDAPQRRRVAGAKEHFNGSARKERACLFCASSLPDGTPPVRAISSSLGGSSMPSNLIDACDFCLREKLDMTPAEYAGWRQSRGLSLVAGEDWNQYNAHIDREKVSRGRVEELLKLAGLKLAKDLTLSERMAAIENALNRSAKQTQEVAKAFLGIDALPISSIKAMSVGVHEGEEALEERLAEFRQTLREVVEEACSPLTSSTQTSTPQKKNRVKTPEQKAQDTFERKWSKYSRASQKAIKSLAIKFGTTSQEVVSLLTSEGIRHRDLSEQERLRLEFLLKQQHAETAPSPPPKSVAPCAVTSPPTQLGGIGNYDWPGEFKPFQHQVETVEFLASHHRAFCLNDMGTGKTLSVLWAFDFLRKRGDVRSMLVICPLSTMTKTWQESIHPKFRMGSKLLYAVDGMGRRKVLDQRADVYIINHDGIKVSGMLDALAKREDIDLIVIDEIAQVARNASSDRYKALRELCWKQFEGKRRIWGLTGTPTPNSLLDAWAQCRLISPERVPPYSDRFRDLVLFRAGIGRWLPRKDGVMIVKAAMQPSIRFERSECIDLPPMIHKSYGVELTQPQAAAYRQMKTDLRTEICGREINVATERGMATKLLQIACGAVYTQIDSKNFDDRVVFVPAQERLDVTKELIEASGGSVLVFVPFRGVLKSVADYLGREMPVQVIHGGVSGSDRAAIFDDFQKEKFKVLVAIPHAMSHGLNLTVANTVIWFGPIYSNDVYQQANARVARPGQKRKQLIVNISATDLEDQIYERLKKRQSLQRLLLKYLS